VFPSPKNLIHGRRRLAFDSVYILNTPGKASKLANIRIALLNAFCRAEKIEFEIKSIYIVIKDTNLAISDLLGSERQRQTTTANRGTTLNRALNLAGTLSGTTLNRGTLDGTALNRALNGTSLNRAPSNW
jgi:hypothetical protein